MKCLKKGWVVFTTWADEQGMSNYEKYKFTLQVAEKDKEKIGNAYIVRKEALHENI